MGQPAGPVTAEADAMLKYLTGPLAVAALSGAAPTDPGDRAKQLFEAMERNVATGKSVQCNFEVKADLSEGRGPAETLNLDGSLVVADGNRVRVEIRERTAGRPPFHLVVSDGRRWWWHDKGSPPHLVNKPPAANMSSDYRVSFARAGVLLPTMPLPPVEAAGPADRFSITEFRLGSEKRVGGREARRVDYNLFVKGQTQPNGGPMPFPVQLWLDAETSLPVKRVVTQKLVDGSGKAIAGMVITETYQKAASGDAVDPKTFELPKVTGETIVQP
jgi:hypothetical protein